jgi:hypothetical protein
MPDTIPQYIVTALTAFLPEIKGAHIIPINANIIEIYSKVYGPASYQDCETWLGPHGGALYRVLTLLTPAGGYQGCHIIPADNIFPAIFRSSFGPDTMANCKAWIAANCGK